MGALDPFVLVGDGSLTRNEAIPWGLWTPKRR